MGFRNDQQLGAVVMALFSRFDSLAGLWGAEGYRPTSLACRYFERPRTKPGWCTSAEHVWRLGWDLWNQHGKAELGDLLLKLDPDHLRCIGRLIVAMGEGVRGEGVDVWLQTYAAPAGDGSAEARS